MAGGVELGHAPDAEAAGVRNHLSQLGLGVGLGRGVSAVLREQSQVGLGAAGSRRVEVDRERSCERNTIVTGHV